MKARIFLVMLALIAIGVGLEVFGVLTRAGEIVLTVAFIIWLLLDAST